MAKRRRDGVWFWVGLVVLIVGGFLIVTAVAAGNVDACNGGGGSIEFRLDVAPPGFACV